MKYYFSSLLVLVFTFFSLTIFAATYYIAPNGSDAAVGDISHPFATLNKAWTLVAAGDLIYMRGGTYSFATQQNLSGKNGTSGNLIKVWAYPGESPLIAINTTSKAISLAGNYINFKGIEINGLAIVSGWTDMGNGIFSKAVTCESPTNMVTINGVNTAMGRYPNADAVNSGYLTIDSHSGTASITDAALPLPSTYNWTGGELVVRRYHWVIDRSIITDHTSHTLTYTGGSSEPMDGYGYFIQNHISTLDQLGEWYYDGTTLFMYFGSNNPTSYVVKTSIVNDLMYVNNSNYVTFENMKFQGGNLTSFRLSNSNYFTLLNSTINYSGQYGFNGYFGGASTYLQISGCTINNSNHSAITLCDAFSNVVIDHNTISNTGIFAGMGTKGNMSGIFEGIWSYLVNYTTVSNNRIINTGFNAIHLNGRASIIKNNTIDTFCKVMDDGGAIYFYTGDVSVTRQIKDNIVLNGIGASNGTTWTDTPQVEGIYMDGTTENVEISGNTAANCGSHGLYLHNAVNINAHNNTLFNNGKEQFKMQHNSEGAATRGIIFKQNIVFSKLSTQNLVHYYSILDDIALFGTMDSNYYAAPLNTTPLTTPLFETKCLNTWALRTFANWKSYSGKDTYSTFSTATVPNTSSIRFEYNDSTVNKTVSLSGTYIDAKGTQYNGSITLLPYTSAVLMSVSSSNNLPPAIQNQGFQINENSPNGTVVGTVVATDPNAGQTLTYSILSGNTNGAFTVNAATGAITVANSAALNYEVVSSFSLVVKVMDSGTGNLSSQATVTIIVININEPPVISNQAFSANVNSPNGTIVGSMIATDPDAGQTLAYSILSGNINNAFAINASSGAITIANSAVLGNSAGGTTYSVFQSAIPPTSAVNYLGNGSTPLEVGMKFTSSTDGFITGLRYYKGDGAQGVHIGNLWNINGTNLASATFTSETTSGWQTITLDAPVAITANTVYVVSYFSAHGDFVKNGSFFTANIVNGPLTGLGWTASQPNGVYTYTSTSAFPNNNAYIGSTNYWADVIFSSTPSPTSFNLVVKVQDNGTGNLSNQANATINLLSGNTPPIISNQTFSVNENSPNGTAVGSIVASDPDAGQTLTYSILSGNTNGTFAINATTGGLSVANYTALNYEVTPTFSLVVNVQDNGSGNLNSQATITINLINVNEVPAISAQAFSINENSPNTTAVGSIVASDPDAGQTLTYSILSGNINSAFAINATTGALSVANSAALNFEVVASFALVVKVMDNGIGNLSNQTTITVNLINVNEAPVISAQAFSINENSPNTTAVGNVVASDPDAGQTLTYSILSGNTNSAFAINATNGSITVANSTALNYEAVTSFALVIKVQDNGIGNLVSQATITITLINVNEPPSINNQTFSVLQMAANGTLVGTVAATDPDAGQTVSYSITSGNTNNAFTINSASGSITVSNSAAVVYQTNPVFVLNVRVTDNGSGSLFSDGTITINVQNTNQPPVINNQTFSVNENSSNGTSVGNVVATDPDAGQTLTYSILSGNTNNAFAINASNGIITVANSAALNYEVITSIALLIKVQDNGTGNLSSQATITVNILNVNEMPAIGNQAFSINENSVNSTVVGNVVATDPDAGQTLAYSILSGNTNNAFLINGTTGALSVGNSVALNYEVTPSFALIVKVQDNGTGNLSNQATITINLSDVNESPVISNQAFSVNINSVAGTTIGTVAASDPDAGQSLAYSISTGNTNNAFAISSSTGVLTVANPSAMLNLAGTNSYSVFQSVTPSATAINYLGNGTAPLEVGMKFFSSVDGYITGLRYYKGDGAQGTHIGNLWNVNGTSLASVTFTSETASGWQTVTLNSPVAITANTIYIVSYFSQHGDYVKTNPYFTSNIVSGPLTALGWTTAQPNGVYTYASASSFPSNNAYVGSTNYWADVTFSSTLPSSSSTIVVNVQDNGAGNLSNQADITINLLSGNTPPTISNQTLSLNENSPNGTVVGTIIAADPNAGQTLTYSILSGNTNNAFAINPTTGVLSVANTIALNYEAVTSFTLIVNVQDNGPGNLSSQGTITINLLNLNESPVISNQTFSINENSPNGTTVGTIIASDPDAGQLITYSILSGNTNGAFVINASTGIITVANSAVLNYEAVSSFVLIINVQDNGTGNLSSQGTATINLLNVNEVPVISNQAFSVNENSPNGTAVGNVLASDPDAGQTLTYSIILGNTNGAFAINTATGVITVANSTALNYEVVTSFMLVVKVTDNGSGNLNSQATITISLLNVNESPVINNQVFVINENSPNGTVVGNIIASDPDVGQTLTYSLLSGNTNGAFVLNAVTGVLTVASTAALNFEMTPSFALLIKVQDNGTGNLSSQSTITVTLLNVNEPPVISNQSFYVSENSPNGTLVGNIVASDPDAGQSLTYSILSGNTNNAFSINASSGALTVASSAVLNYEVISSFSLVINVQDNGIGNLASQATCIITLLNVNEPPVISDQVFQVNENSPNGFVIGTVTASDPDVGQTITFSIVSGNTNNAFAINPSTGIISVANSTALDFEAYPSYALTVKVQDNGIGNLINQANIIITILDINEPPSISNQDFSVYENSPNGTIIGNIVASDPDAGQVLTYSILSGNTNNAFAINSVTGVLTVNNYAALDYEVLTLFSLVVKVQDNGAGNLSSQANVNVSVLDLTESPAIATWPLTTNTSPSALVGNITAGNMTNGSGIATVSFTGGAYVSTRAYNGTSLATAISNYDYLQFTILPTSGNNLVVNTISLYMGVSGGSMSASLLYSTDASFASYQTAGSVTGFSNTTVAQSSFTSLGINVNNGQTLYVRIYGWNLGSTYYFRTKAVVISGTTWSIPKITLTMGTNFISGLNTYNNTDNPILNDSVHILSGELTEQHQTSTLRLSNEKAHPNSDKARIFPNPVTNGILNVELENGISEQFNLAIFDMSGKTLIKRDYSHLNSLSLDLSAYPTGIYALQIQSSNFIFSDKFILK